MGSSCSSPRPGATAGAWNSRPRAPGPDVAAAHVAARKVECRVPPAEASLQDGGAFGHAALSAAFWEQVALFDGPAPCTPGIIASEMCCAKTAEAHGRLCAASASIPVGQPVQRHACGMLLVEEDCTQVSMCDHDADSASDSGASVCTGAGAPSALPGGTLGSMLGLAGSVSVSRPVVSAVAADAEHAARTGSMRRAVHDDRRPLPRALPVEGSVEEQTRGARAGYPVVVAAAGCRTASALGRQRPGPRPGPRHVTATGRLAPPRQPFCTLSAQEIASEVSAQVARGKRVLQVQTCLGWELLLFCEQDDLTKSSCRFLADRGLSSLCREKLRQRLQHMVKLGLSHDVVDIVDLV